MSNTSDNKELNEILKKAGVPTEGLDPFMKGSQNSNPPAYSWKDDLIDDSIYDVEEKIEQGYCQWSTSDNRIFVPSTKTTDVLIPGVYEIDVSPNIGLFFEKIPVRTEGLLRFPDSNSDEVIEEISKFWDREEVFKHYNLIYKRGIILWGPPGSGKSCVIQLIMEDVVKRDGVVIRFDDPDLFLDGMRAVRKIQPETPVVVIMEDIDSIIQQYSESEVLNILDGVNEVHKVVFLATTNYPGVLGDRIINRPSRFDKRWKIGMPKAAARRMYFEHLFEKVSEEDREKLSLDIDTWVEDTRGFSIAHLKELFVAVCILENDYKQAIETLQSMMEDEVKDEDTNNIGFNAGGYQSEVED